MRDAGQRDDELASVRIEVDEASGAAGVVPVPGQPGPSKALLGFGLVVVLAVVAAVLFLRPTGEQAADGTERVDPTETTVPENSLADEADDIEASPSTTPSTITPNIVTTRLDEPVTPEEVESVGRISQIFATDLGFVALPRVEPAGDVLLLRSDDGRVWEELDGPIDVLADGAEASIDWFSLERPEDALVLVGWRTTDGSPIIATSELGTSWEVVAMPLAFSDSLRSIFPVAFGEDYFVGLGFVESLKRQALPSLLVETRDEGECGAFEAVPTEFALSDCADFSSFGDSTIAEPDVVLESCAAGPPGVAGFAVFDFERSDTAADDQWSETTNSVFQLSATPSFEDLGRGRVAILDSGNAALQLCDSDDVLPARDPGIVVVNVVQNRAIAYPAPAEIADDIDQNAVVLAEVQLFDRSTHLITAAGGALWATDLATGQWTALTDQRGDLGFQTPFSPQFGVSESGDRFYQIANNSLSVFELEVDERGDIRVAETTAPIDPATAGEVISGFGRIMYATDDVLFYAGATTVWRFEVPDTT